MHNVSTYSQKHRAAWGEKYTAAVFVPQVVAPFTRNTVPPQAKSSGDAVVVPSLQILTPLIKLKTWQLAHAPGSVGSIFLYTCGSLHSPLLVGFDNGTCENIATLGSKQRIFLGPSASYSDRLQLYRASI